MSTPQRSRILIAESHAFLAAAMKSLLTRRGHLVTAVLDGEKACKAYRSGKFDIVITSLCLPNVDGLQLIDWLRNEEASRLPIILMTDEKKEAVDARLRGKGVVAVLEKPFDANRVLDAIRKCTSRHA